jgi:hypothetical protein
MAFNNVGIARYAGLIEKLIWAKRWPPLHLRGKVREGQRIEGHEIELFLVRPMFSDPTREIEESIAKARYVKSRDVWQGFWKRADMKWHRYLPPGGSEIARGIPQAGARRRKSLFLGPSGLPGPPARSRRRLTI